MKRREFLTLSAATAVGSIVLGKSQVGLAGSAVTEKDILKEGMPTTIANYCESPEKQPNKVCADWTQKKGYCDTCMFFNKDNSLTTFKGKSYARCQLLTDPKKPQFVEAKAYCSTWVKKA